MVAPAASRRVTTVASRRGTYPSTAADPFIIGTPATAMLSFTATRRPASGPALAPAISVVTYQAPSSLPSAAGQSYGRSGGSERRASYSRRTASYDCSAPVTSPRNDPRSSADSGKPYCAAIRARSWSDGGSMPGPAGWDTAGSAGCGLVTLAS